MTISRPSAIKQRNSGVEGENQTSRGDARAAGDAGPQFCDARCEKTKCEVSSGTLRSRGRCSRTRFPERGRGQGAAGPTLTGTIKPQTGEPKAREDRSPKPGPNTSLQPPRGVSCASGRRRPSPRPRSTLITRKCSPSPQRFQQCRPRAAGKVTRTLKLGGSARGRKGSPRTPASRTDSASVLIPPLYPTKRRGPHSTPRADSVPPQYPRADPPLP